MNISKYHEYIKIQKKTTVDVWKVLSQIIVFAQSFRINWFPFADNIFIVLNIKKKDKETVCVIYKKMSVFL